MDYKKKYNEMVRRAKELYESGNALTRQQMEIVCPELTESEDEKIRKEIIDYIKSGKPQRCYNKRWIAYLEKQKEQKPVEIYEPSDAELQRHQDELYNFKVFAAKQAREHHISFVHDFEWNNFCAELLSYFNEKQKPADKDAVEPTPKQDYSKLNDLERAIHRGFLCAGVENVPVGIIKETAQDCLAHIEQKERPDTRTADDLQLLGFIYDLLATLDWRENWAMSKEECLRRLKSLRPQPRQEWSEEDENALKYLHELIGDGYVRKYMDAQTAADLKEWLNTKLKSLRPSWKPSEEQLAALQVAAIESKTDFQTLTSLLTDLKKLM